MMTLQLAMKLALCLIWLGSSGCFEGSPTASQVQTPAQQSQALLDELAQVGERCQQTGGHWRPMMLSCRCPAHMVFIVEQGCMTLKSPEFDDLIKLQHALEQNGYLTSAKPNSYTRQSLILFYGGHHHHSIDFKYSSQSGANYWHTTFKTDITRVVEDISLSHNPNANAFQTIYSSQLWRSDYSQWYQPRETGAEEVFSERYLVDVRDMQRARANSSLPTVEACMVGIEQAWQLHMQAEPLEVLGLSLDELCHGLLAAADSLSDRAVTERHFSSMRSYKPHCAGNCTASATLQIGRLSFSFDVILHGFVAMQRRLTLALPNNQFLRTALSPSGNFLHIGLEAVAPAAADSGFAYHGFSAAWDEAFQPIRHADWDFGSRDNFKKSASLAGQDWVLPTDIHKHISLAPVAAAVIDHQFRLGPAAFNKRLALDASAQQNLLNANDFSRNLFTGEASSAANLSLNRFFVANQENISELEQQQIHHFNSEMSSMAEHGHKVAFWLMQDLPNSRVDLIGVAEYQRGDLKPAEAAALLCERLHRNQVRVVTMPYGLDEYLPYCTEWMKHLANVCHDVLFVVSAGNLEAELLGEDCPSGLDAVLDNVISVAGVDKSQHRLDSSTFSANLVTLAGPMEVGFFENGQWHNFGGTSYAAPTIANAALHALARRPELTATDLVKRLTQHCFADHLPLVCGGAVDLKKFFANEVVPYNPHSKRETVL